MGAGYVAILTVELHFPDVASLKGKRHYVRRAKDNLRNRFGASVAEVDHHDLWQRAALTIACVARSARDADDLLDGAERWLHGQEWEVVRNGRLLITPIFGYRRSLRPCIALADRSRSTNVIL